MARFVTLRLSIVVARKTASPYRRWSYWRTRLPPIVREIVDEETFIMAAYCDDITCASVQATPQRGHLSLLRLPLYYRPYVNWLPTRVYCYLRHCCQSLLAQYAATKGHYTATLSRRCLLLLRAVLSYKVARNDGQSGFTSEAASV